VRTAKIIKCAWCKKRIARSEPDLILRDDTTAKVRYYHVGCGADAVAKVAQNPGLYFLTHRYIEAEAN
jgi:hypothetical protein